MVSEHTPQHVRNMKGMDLELVARLALFDGLSGPELDLAVQMLPWRQRCKLSDYGYIRQIDPPGILPRRVRYNECIIELIQAAKAVTTNRSDDEHLQPPEVLAVVD